MTVPEAFVSAIADEMRRDSRVFYMGTAPVPRLEAEFGHDRSRRTPIAENAIAGIAVGAALRGWRPVFNISNTSFAYSAFDQLVNQAAKATYMFGPQASVPVVFRASYSTGTRTAAQHSQSAYAMYAHAGGLKIIVPSTPAAAKGLLLTAIRSDDPVICVETRRLESLEGEVPDAQEPIPFGQAEVVRTGTDVTVVGILNTVHLALSAYDDLAEIGVSAEVIDPRTLVPFDSELVRASVRRTGRLVVVDESFPTCSFASEIVAAVCEDPTTFGCLRSPVRRVCTKPVPIPFSGVLEDFVVPNAQDVVAAVMEIMS
jgi:acetoin:2,6-dichlorophenolindophenol oxidoreductase subunit beta